MNGYIVNLAIVLSMCILSFIFCDWNWSFCVKTNHRLLIYILQLEIHLSSREGWNPINRLKPATFVVMPQARTWISNVICRGVSCVLSVKVGGDCSLCWYWWNCWLSLLKMSFHNITVYASYTVANMDKKLINRYWQA